MSMASGAGPGLDFSIVGDMEMEPALSEARVQISGEDAPGELRSLSEWLGGEEALRRQVRLTAEPTAPGTMGGAMECLAIALGPGGVAASFAPVLIAWIRSRTAAITIELSRRDGTSVRLEAKNVRALPRQQVGELTDEVAELLTRADADAADATDAETATAATDAEMATAATGAGDDGDTGNDGDTRDAAGR